MGKLSVLVGEAAVPVTPGQGESGPTLKHRHSCKEQILYNPEAKTHTQALYQGCNRRHVSDLDRSDNNGRSRTATRLSHRSPVPGQLGPLIPISVVQGLAVQSCNSIVVVGQIPGSSQQRGIRERMPGGYGMRLGMGGLSYLISSFRKRVRERGTALQKGVQSRKMQIPLDGQPSMSKPCNLIGAGQLGGEWAQKVTALRRVQMRVWE
ncbi:hypothetical protein BX600DRAFT_321481 [Xylariales sp. PMI_506]|nr:hypothetical protein BX600DRAFT_321481 [Xylariales sp. PMI_506]